MWSPLLVLLLHFVAICSFRFENKVFDRAFLRSNSLVQKSQELRKPCTIAARPLSLYQAFYRCYRGKDSTTLLSRRRRQDSFESLDVNSETGDPELHFGMEEAPEPKKGRKRSKNPAVCSVDVSKDAIAASDGDESPSISDPGGDSTSTEVDADESYGPSESNNMDNEEEELDNGTRDLSDGGVNIRDLEGFQGSGSVYEDNSRETNIGTRIERRLKRLRRADLDAGLDVVEDAVPQSKLPIVAVIGRPNTGKSTIVNRICDTYNEGSIVDDTPGVTRDRSYRPAVWNGYNFQVVDTGGILFDDKADDVFASKITEQAMIAIDEAAACIFVCDGIAGVTNQDRDVAEWLRRHKSHIPIYLAVNKCESEIKGLAQALDFTELGLGEPIPVSGIHGMGIGDILDKITETHMKKIVNVLEENVTNVAFIGRPNVGKSSLFNKIYGKNRTIVSDVAGTTRDPIDEIVIRGADKYRIIDTAGIRKKSKVDYGTEFFMINRAFKAIRRADVCVLLLDATQGVLVQDRELADRIVAEGRACVIALNKWDVVPSKDEKTYIGCIDNIHASLNHLRWAEVVLVSAKTGQRIDKVLTAAKKAETQFRRWVTTRALTEIINDALNFHSPPRVGSKSGRIHYCVQSSTAPPTFVLFCNDPKLFADSYRQYLERKIRESLGFEGTPIKIIFRQKTLRKVIMSKDANGEMKRKYV